ncbi:MAG: hypothetical protein Q8O85_09870 [Rhodoferax sp.]|uniref:hypothetical protein n=1 Tax=Rhodoferax sp. TaxID=50421 RepID=UPI0008C5807A|nr:hypothetical protein [Rhodoferax sp.]MDP2679015.1 hypothetical protein [Rhodoferax sp.]OGB51170.1 MAG: hypothetical protein A2503_10765 [Burkholderiales bacterium RIFOXYD12_FULL_59_19]
MNFTPAHFADPQSRLSAYEPTRADHALHDLVLASLRSGEVDEQGLRDAFAASSLPQRVVRIVMILYAAAERRILVTRATKLDTPAAACFVEVIQRLVAHPRRAQMDATRMRLQLDLVQEPPRAADFFAMGMSQPGDRHFEIGVDGLLMQGAEGKLHVFPPGDGYVRSVMSMGQLRDYLNRVYGEDYLRACKFQCFRSASFITSASGWRALYRGHPVVGPLTRQKIEHALQLAVGHIQLTQKGDGKFLYYYDAALDSRRDHEHPGRDVVKNPYYNILRHGGGALTCLFHEKISQLGNTWPNITRAIDYLVAQARQQDYQGQTGAYIYSEKKSKLGGTGIALYLLAQYQKVSGDSQYRQWADQMACHLVNQITASGEFIYYNIYLDKPVSEAENPSHFSFFYPGEAVCGLAAYLHLLTPEQREPIFAKLRLALQFLLVERPLVRASEYSVLPSDGWLMMGIMELWDFEAMRDPLYSDFVFSDARKMIERMYKVSDAPYPDYAGGYYYNFGDYPYADGARCEGLLGAYELAVKMNDTETAQALWQAICLAAWALLHLVNTEDSIYFAPKPALALGGIRFKYTRQWFRIDTIQHVASFFAKLLPYWDANDALAPQQRVASPAKPQNEAV